jgi:hypothetical protein
MPEGIRTSLGDLQPYWANQQMFGASLITLFIDCYGTEGLTWDPVTVQLEIEQDSGIEIPATSFDRLLTAINLIVTNTFFTSVPDFLRACVVLSGHEVSPSNLILPDAVDLAWGITEALFISPPEDDDHNPFVPEITAYIGHVLDSEGIINPPDVLRIATRDKELSDRVNYDYSDDPEMFGAINQMESGKTDDINRVIRGRMTALIIQLQSLPIRNGKMEQVIKRMLASLPKGEEPLPLPV